MDKTQKKSLLVLTIACIVGVVIALLPPPEGLTTQSMSYLGIFSGMLLVIIFDAMPSWAASLGALALMVVFKVDKAKVVFSDFSGSIVWLMIGVFAFSLAIANSGLMNRFALKLLRLFPKNYRGQVLSLMSVGFLLSPLIPSTNAKVNLLLPMATAMTEQIGYEKRSKPALGLFTACFMPPYIGSHAFLTGGVNVIFAIGIMNSYTPMQFTWLGWLKLTFVWLIILLLGTYLYCVYICKPKHDIKLSPHYLDEALAKLGPMSFKEKAALAVIFGALSFWLLEPIIKVPAGMICILASIILHLCGLLSSKDFSTKMPWGLIIFIGSLICAVSLMQSTGVSDWVSQILAPLASPLTQNSYIFVTALCILTWILRAFIPAQGVVLIILASVFGKLLPEAGISIFVLCFVEYLVGNVWFNKFQNPFVLGALSVAGNEYVTIKEFKQASWAYMLISLIAMNASIPLWKFFGLA